MVQSDAVTLDTVRYDQRGECAIPKMANCSILKSAEKTETRALNLLKHAKVQLICHGGVWQYGSHIYNITSLR